MWKNGYSDAERNAIQLLSTTCCDMLALTDPKWEEIWCSWTYLEQAKVHLPQWLQVFTTRSCQPCSKPSCNGRGLWLLELAELLLSEASHIFFIQSRACRSVYKFYLFIQCICIAVVRWLGCPESCGRFKYLILFAEGLLWSLRSVFGRDDILCYWVG